MVKLKTLIDFLDHYGKVTSNLVEDMFKNSEDSEGDTATGICSLRLKLNKVACVENFTSKIKDFDKELFGNWNQIIECAKIQEQTQGELQQHSLPQFGNMTIANTPPPPHAKQKLLSALENALKLCTPNLSREMSFHTLHNLNARANQDQVTIIQNF